MRVRFTKFGLESVFNPTFPARILGDNAGTLRDARASLQPELWPKAANRRSLTCAEIAPLDNGDHGIGFKT
jgi:hypothetical protein